MKTSGFVIAIDGPVASGKGTIAPLLAKKLSGHYLDTGMYYRGCALWCMRNEVPLTDVKKVIALLPSLDLDYKEGRIVLNNEDITDLIRLPQVSLGASQVGAIKEVRESLVKRQQEWISKMVDSGEIVIVEGRDAATVIYPAADIKIFLTAMVEERAKRRLAQIHAKGDTNATYEQVLEDTRERDARDMGRDVSPLSSDPQKDGYDIIDSTGKKEDETFTMILDLLSSKGYYDQN